MTLAKRSTLIDVAQAAGVSRATVDRVLNQRTGVRTPTAQRVFKAAAQLDYLPEADLAAALAPPPLKIVFLLPAQTSRFVRMVGEMVACTAAQWAPLNVRCRVEHIQGFDPQALAQSLLRLGSRCDGIAFMALEHPAVREAVATLAERGRPVVTLITDLSNSARVAYVGLDNRAAGRTAGYLLGRFMGRPTGQVALIAGSLSYRAHEEREVGFLHLMQETYPRVRVVGRREGRDDAQQTYLQVRQVLEECPALDGLYNVGGASDGVARALREAGRAGRTVFVGHGLTPDTREALIDGTMDAVITQPPQSMIAGCVRIFANLRDGRETLAGVELARSTIVIRENLP